MPQYIILIYYININNLLCLFFIHIATNVSLPSVFNNKISDGII